MTRQQAINEKCKGCSYDSFDKGTWREQVENCFDLNCALYEYRPITSTTKKRLNQEKYEQMSEEEKIAYDKKAKIAKERFRTR